MGNSASALPYSIGNQVSKGNDGWTLHEGACQADNAPVSVFVAKKPMLNKSQQQQQGLSLLPVALHHFSYGRRLRHPHILQVLASLDTDHPDRSAADAATTTNSNSSTAAINTKETGDLMLVTEACVPLTMWLQSHPPPEEISWALESILRALQFLHTSGPLAHGNVHPDALFVTKAGDVKLWSFGLVTTTLQKNSPVPQQFQDYEGILTPQAYRSPERIQGRWDVVANAPIHAMDAYSIGVLVGFLYNDAIPGPLQKAVQRLLTPNVTSRPRLQPLLQCPLFNTPYQKLQLQLEEFTIAPIEQKVQFWQNLLPQLQAQLVPSALARYKLLPLQKMNIMTTLQADTLRTQDWYKREILAMLPSMFYIAQHFVDEKDFGRELSTLLAMLFTLNDRSVRGALLQKASFLAQRLDQSSLNAKVFEPLCSGFADSSAALRELTLKATLHLVPHLNPPNLEKLSRYLVRLQADPEASIRTNTIIFVGKLASYLTETTRQKLLLPALQRSLKDAFIPCRLAALSSCSTLKTYFPPNAVATQLLPCIIPCCLDKAAPVRKQAFVVVEDLLFMVRQESERLNSLPEPNAKNAVETTTPKAAVAVDTAAAPASGGYFSSWMKSSASSSPTAPATAPVNTTTPVTNNVAHMSISNNSTSSNNYNNNNTNIYEEEDDDEDSLKNFDANGDWADDDDNNNDGLNDDFGGGDMDDGWGDDGNLDNDNWDAGLDNNPAPTTIKTNKTAVVAPPQKAVLAPASEDDFFGSFDNKPAKSANLRGKLVVPAKKSSSKMAKPAVKKLAVDKSVEDGWDDF